MAEKKNPYTEIEQRTGARGFGPTAAVVMPRTQASTAQSATSAQIGQAKLPFVPETSAAEMRSKKTQAEIDALKLQKARSDVRSAADQALREAEEVITTSNRVLKNPALPDIVGRGFNPAYGMFGHYDLEKETGVSGQPRLFWPGTDASTLNADMEFLQRKAYMQGRGAMKGQGAIQAGEAIRAAGAEAVLDPRLPPVEYAKRVIDFRNKAIDKANKLKAIQAEEQKRAVAQGLVLADGDTSFKILSIKPVK